VLAILNTFCTQRGRRGSGAAAYNVRLLPLYGFLTSRFFWTFGEAGRIWRHGPEV